MGVPYHTMGSRTSYIATVAMQQVAMDVGMVNDQVNEMARRLDEHDKDGSFLR